MCRTFVLFRSRTMHLLTTAVRYAMLKQQQQTHMCITCCIFKSVGAFQTLFHLKEKVLLLKLKNKIKYLYLYMQLIRMQGFGKINLFTKAYPACVYSKITRNCTGEFWICVDENVGIRTLYMIQLFPNCATFSLIVPLRELCGIRQQSAVELCNGRQPWSKNTALWNCKITRTGFCHVDKNTLNINIE